MLRRVLSCIIITANIFFFVPGSALATHSFNFSGRGWGHGLGMSQYGAKGYAENGRNFQQILAHFYQKTALKKTSAKTFRILIASGRSQISFSAKSDFSVLSEVSGKTYTFKGGHNYRSTIKSGKIYIRDITSSQDIGYFAKPAQIKGGNALKLLSADDNGFQNNYYRGWFRLLISNNTLNMVNYVNSEHYLYGVVPREMPASWTMEALKAQAVAARSYSFATVRTNTFFDLYATVYSHVYGGWSAENSRTTKATQGTAGQVLTYKGRVIQAFFHSSSGGYTENNENVWGGTPLAWLRSVNSPYEGSAANWPSTYSYPASYVQSKLGKYNSSTSWGVKGQLKDLVVVKRAASPRVLKVRVVGTGGNSYITGSKLRSILGLRSTWFYINRRGETASVKKITLSINGSAKTVRRNQWLAIYSRISPASKGTIVLRYNRGSGWRTAASVRVNGSSYVIRVKPSTRNTYKFSARLDKSTSSVMIIYSR